MLRALLFLAWMVPTVALAEGGALEDARRAYEELRYDEAALLLEGALEDAELEAREREEALLLAGVLDVILGEEERARSRFHELLERAPDATLPGRLSPKITRVFDEVRAALREARAAKEPPAAPPMEPLPTEPAPVEVAPVPSPSGTELASAPSPRAPSPQPPAVDAESEEGISALVVGVAAGAALTAVVVGVTAGAVLFLAQSRPPESSLGTMQLP